MKPTERGEKREYIALTDDAYTAYDVWGAITAVRWAERNEHTTKRGIHRDLVDAALADESRPVLAALLRLAISAAESDPLDWDQPTNELWSRWHIANALRDESLRLAPPARVVIEQDDHCRHGVKFTDTCTDCDADA